MNMQGIFTQDLNVFVLFECVNLIYSEEDMSIYTVIMAGGIGSRFWPQSTPARPKQFLDILQAGATMIQQTVNRVSAFCPVDHLFVVTSKAYIPLVLEQVPGLKEEQVLGEPCMRNTAPCIAYAVWKIRQRDPSGRILVLPSDSYIPDADLFEENMLTGLRYIGEYPAIMTLGIKPSGPETGYGYIEAEKATMNDEKIHQVKSFREKPQAEQAREYVASGNFYWNAGIFMASAATFEQSYRRHLPEMAVQFDKGNDIYYTAEEQNFIDCLYPSCENISVDYGIMEKADNIVVQEAAFSWSDLGAWNALYELQSKDENGNTSFEHAPGGRKVLYEEVHNCLVSVPESTQAVIQGVSDLIIVQSENRLLICRKENEQEIKKYVGRL
jgi:mannose-1-phosphate guanylyltransferase